MKKKQTQNKKIARKTTKGRVQRNKCLFLLPTRSDSAYGTKQSVERARVNSVQKGDQKEEASNNIPPPIRILISEYSTLIAE